MRRILVSCSVIVSLLALSPAPSVDAGGGGGPDLLVEELVDGLTIPWGLDFAPDGTMYFTERGGSWWSLAPGPDSNYDGPPVAVQFDYSDLYVSGETGLSDETGLMDLIVDPNFAENRRVYTCQGHQAGAAAPRVQVIKWEMSPDHTQATRRRDPLVDNVTRWGQQPGRHGGCRMAFDAAGRLYIGTGDGARTNNPQNLRTLGGKVLRVNRHNGRGVAENRWGANPNANRRRIWTYGHRNVQGLALRPGTAGQMWAVEHGTFRDDEVNRLLRGRNYGWQPGPNYNESAPMTNLNRFPNAVPAKWRSGTSTIAPSGGVFLEGSQWGAWNGALAVAVLKNQQLAVFGLDGATLLDPVFPEALNTHYGRLRTPVLGPNGDLYVTTANGNGNDRILRITPNV